ncbi:glycosyltransferase family 4 protein [Paludibaculum fermentans]|uniref:glycosyltransferase family 4 protein n=1 Tax=Paludibaculum fermentans TaxID=1473598 RepID=UPI003EBAD9D6
MLFLNAQNGAACSNPTWPRQVRPLLLVESVSARLVDGTDDPWGHALMHRREGITVGQLGSRMHYAVARVLSERNRLKDFYTDICSVRGWPRLLRYLPEERLPRWMNRLRGRVPVGVPVDRVRAFTGFGWEYARRRRAARSKAEMAIVHLWAGRTFCELLLRDKALDGEAIYLFNTAALEALQQAGARNLKGVVEQTIAPLELEMAVLREESRRFAGWEAQSDEAFRGEELVAREKAEWDAASTIVCGSEFVRDGIRSVGGPWQKCVVVPYGVGHDEPRGRVRAQLAGRPLRVLFVGAVGLRKGVQYLAEAATLLPKSGFEFRAVGGTGFSPEVLRRLGERVTLTGAVPRTQVGEEFAWADVFAFPSLCEGSATVCYEALRAGLPVVTTNNAGSVVRDGVEGFVVPIRDPRALADRLTRFVDDPALLPSASEAALLRAGQFTVEKYGDRLCSEVFANS